MQEYFRLAGGVLAFGVAAIAVEVWATPADMNDSRRLSIFGGECCTTCTSSDPFCATGCTGTSYHEISGDGQSAGRQIKVLTTGCTGGVGCEKDEEFNGTCSET